MMRDQAQARMAIASLEGGSVEERIRSLLDVIVGASLDLERAEARQEAQMFVEPRRP
jgi:hypothetical protein